VFDRDGVLVSADALLVCVPTFPEGGSIYPSVNHTGKDSYKSGRKTLEYNALHRAIICEAKRQMTESGWVRADYYVEVHWKRYVTTLRPFDASNAMKCENDALQLAGVFANDNLVRPFPDVPQYDPTPGAIDRIVMVVIRLFPPAILAEKPTRKRGERKEHDTHDAFAEAQAEARKRMAERPRTIDEIHRAGGQARPNEVQSILKAGRHK
jgi:Holliday junction resolvase RusA-like endonuclease